MKERKEDYYKNNIAQNERRKEKFILWIFGIKKKLILLISGSKRRSFSTQGVGRKMIVP